MKTIADVRQSANDAIEAGDASQLYRFRKEVGMDISDFIRAYDGGNLYVSGYWGLGLDVRGALSDYRVQIDAVAGKLLAAQQWSECKYQDVEGDQLQQLERDLIEINGVNAQPGAFAMAFEDKLQPWAAHALGGAKEPFVERSQLDSITIEFELPGDFGKGWEYVEASSWLQLNRNFARDCLERWGMETGGLDTDGEPRVSVVVHDTAEIAPWLAALNRLCKAFKERDSENVTYLGSGGGYTVALEDGVELRVPLGVFEEKRLPPEYLAAKQYTTPEAFVHHFQQQDQVTGLSMDEASPQVQVASVGARYRLPATLGVGWAYRSLYAPESEVSVNLVEQTLLRIDGVNSVTLAVDGYDGWISFNAETTEQLQTQQEFLDRVCEMFPPRPDYQMVMNAVGSAMIFSVELPESHSPDGPVVLLEDVSFGEFLKRNCPAGYFISMERASNEEFLRRCAALDSLPAQATDGKVSAPVLGQIDSPSPGM